MHDHVVLLHAHIFTVNNAGQSLVNPPNPHHLPSASKQTILPSHSSIYLLCKNALMLPRHFGFGPLVTAPPASTMLLVPFLPPLSRQVNPTEDCKQYMYSHFSLLPPPGSPFTPQFLVQRSVVHWSVDPSHVGCSRLEDEGERKERGAGLYGTILM